MKIKPIARGEIESSFLLVYMSSYFLSIFGLTAAH